MNPRPAPLIERRQSRPSERPTLRPAVPPARATVEVLREDTIDAVIAALRATGGATVRIVVPRDARALNRPEHVRFLAGFLRREGCQAIIATDDAVLAELAAAGGIPTEPLGHGAEARADAPAGRALPDLPGHARARRVAPHVPWSVLRSPPEAGLGGYAGARRAAPGEPADDELDLPSGPVFRRVRPRAGGRPVRSGRDFDAPTTLHRLRIARVAGLAVLVFLGYMALAYFVFPSATVVVTPHATYLPVELTVRVDPDAVEVDERRGVIPAQIREAVVRDTLSKPTTGRRRDTESVAAGEVILRNRTAQPLIAPRGTRVRTADGVAFVTSSEVLIPPTLNVGDRPVPGEARVLAVAELGGMAGNVSALAIAAVEGPFAGVLDAVNPRPFTGGAEREVALVATKDRDELLTTLRERLQSSAVEELKRQRGDQRSLVVWSPESGNLEILEKKFSAGADERAANLSLDMSLRTRGTSFANADLERLLAAALARTPAARDVSVDRIYVTATNLLSEQLGVVTLHVRAVGEVVARIDRGAVRDRVTGRSIDEGLAALGRMPGVAAYAASHDPADTANFPRLGFRIDVKIETPAPAPAS